MKQEQTKRYFEDAARLHGWHFGTVARPDSECVLERKEVQIEMEFYNCKQERMDGVLERNQERMDDILELQQELIELEF